MIQIRRVLHATDFSEDSLEAAKYACFFAERFQAELHLLHVFEDSMAKMPVPSSAFPPPGERADELSPVAGAELAGLFGFSLPESVRVVRATWQGSPVHEIVRYVETQGIDLVVMGTRGRTGLAHIVMGSVAHDVVRKAHCPVLTVHPHKPDGDEDAA